MEHQIDCCRRLKIMYNNALHLEQEENATAKRTAKYHSTMAKKLEIIRRQTREFEKINALLNQHGEELQNRISLNHAVQDQVAAADQENDVMQAQLAEKIQEQNELMGRVRTLCEATNTYINTKALPQRIKGVTVVPETGEWLPLDYALDDFKDLSTLLTELEQRSSANGNKLRQLMSKSKPTGGKENPSITLSSIIEIDLTSPPPRK